MKAQPCKSVPGEGYVACPVEEATHLTLNIPGPTGRLTLPVIRHGTRAGTGCWTWNGDTEKPTLKPSVLHTTGCHIEALDHQKDSCWCKYKKQHPDEDVHFECYRCHTWINDGKAQFLDDCTHNLKGQTVELLNVPNSRI